MVITNVFFSVSSKHYQPREIALVSLTRSVSREETYTVQLTSENQDLFDESELRVNLAVLVSLLCPCRLPEIVFCVSVGSSAIL